MSLYDGRTIDDWCSDKLRAKDAEIERLTRELSAPRLAWIPRRIRYSALIAEKDAEIERLKAEFQKAKEWNQLCELQIRNLQSIVEDQNAEIQDWKENERRAVALITELCDALTRVRPHLAQPDLDLIQRGRETTR